MESVEKFNLIPKSSMLNIATDLNNRNTEIIRMFIAVALQTLYQQKTLRRLEWISTNNPACSLRASKDHINRRQQNKNAEEYSNLRQRKNQVADKNVIMRNITIFNFYNFTHKLNVNVQNGWSSTCTVPVWPHAVDRANFIC